MQKLKLKSTFLLAGNRIIKKNNIFAKVNFNYFNQMKKTLLIIASALFLTLMGVSCCDCDCGENKGNGDNSNATTETVNETKGTDAGQNAEAPKTQSQEKNLLIKRADIDKVNKFIDEGKKICLKHTSPLTTIIPISRKISKAVFQLKCFFIYFIIL